MLAVNAAVSPALSSNPRRIPKFVLMVGPTPPGIVGKSPNDSPLKVPVKKLLAEPAAPWSSVPTVVPEKMSEGDPSTNAE